MKKLKYEYFNGLQKKYSNKDINKICKKAKYSNQVGLGENCLLFIIKKPFLGVLPILQVYKAEKAYIIEKHFDGVTHFETCKDNENVFFKKIYEIKANRNELANFIKLISADYYKQCKQENFTSLLYY